MDTKKDQDRAKRPPQVIRLDDLLPRDNVRGGKGTASTVFGSRQSNSSSKRPRI